MEKKLYSIDDFIYCLTKYNYDISHLKQFSQAQIANIIGKAMVSFFDDSETSY